MERRTNLFFVIGEWWEQRQARRAQAIGTQANTNGPAWLPTPGNTVFTIIFTLLVIAGLLWAQSVGAITLGAPMAAGASTGTIAYQGRLADMAGQPLTGTYNMAFRLYSTASGGAPIWQEAWTGPNSVQVSDGLFNVMLGSLSAIPQVVVAGNSALFLGITVGTDSEMAPRVQLGSVPFAVQALTVPDGSVTTVQLADGAVTKAKLATDAIAQYGGQPNSFPSVLHLTRFGLSMGNYCFGYVPVDPARPDCASLDQFATGIKTYLPSGTGRVVAYNNFPDASGNPRWGYTYSFFMTNPTAARSIQIPLQSCNDVAIYVTTGGVGPDQLGTSYNLAYHRFPGNDPNDPNLRSCSCLALDPTIQIPAGAFRLTVVTRGAACTSYINLGATSSNWIRDANLSIDWNSLRSYLGEN